MNTPDEIKNAAARTAQMWVGDWEIYLGEVSRLTGLTLEQALLWDLALTFRDMNVNQHANLAFVKKHIEEEHKPDDWQRPPEEV